jgi:hypothetical protein
VLELLDRGSELSFIGFEKVAIDEILVYCKGIGDGQLI